LWYIAERTRSRLTVERGIPEVVNVGPEVNVTIMYSVLNTVQPAHDVAACVGMVVPLRLCW